MRADGFARSISATESSATYDEACSRAVPGTNATPGTTPALTAPADAGGAGLAAGGCRPGAGTVTFGRWVGRPRVSGCTRGGAWVALGCVWPCTHPLAVTAAPVGVRGQRSRPS